ncbi:MAG: hypothetical protein ACKOD2_09900 [Ilumatobacteraceae bacterium]
MVGVKLSESGGIARLVFDHPPINLFTFDVFVETAGLIQRVATDDSVRVLG